MIKTLKGRREQKLREQALEEEHRTQKPVPLLKELIRLFTDPGDVVIDPCAGSGTTLIAADELGRKAYGFECDTAIYHKAKKLLTEHKTQITFETISKPVENTEQIRMGGGVAMMYLWLEVTQDKYELPIAVAQTAEELAKMRGIKKQAVQTAVWRYEHQGLNTRFRRVRS